MEEKDLTREAAELYLYGGGFTIYTTQDSKIQETMNEEMQKAKYLKYQNLDINEYIYFFTSFFMFYN